MTPDVMSQSEIDSLLEALSTGSVDVDSITRDSDEKKIKSYDFRRPTSSARTGAGDQLITNRSPGSGHTMSAMVLDGTAEIASVDQLA